MSSKFTAIEKEKIHFHLKQHLLLEVMIIIYFLYLKIKKDTTIKTT